MIFSKTKIQLTISAWLVAIFVLVVFLLLNAEIFLPIGKNIIDGSGDGLKNLYTFGYYLKYGSGLTFNGMLYPFGDHIIYMDAQPLYVWLIWFVEFLFRFKVENPIIYIHLIIYANIFFAAFFIFLILRYFGVSLLIAFVGTTIIVLLSPQIYRIGDHFALGSIAVIPFFWWWRLQIRNSKLHYLIYAITLSFVGFIHPYLLFMIVLLLLSYEFIVLIFYKKSIDILFPLIAFLLFYSIILLTDHASNRPENAWGAMAFSCKWYDIFLPIYGSVKGYFLNKFSSITPNYTEGHAYITVFGIFILGASIFKLFQQIINKQFIKIKANSIELWLLASIPILLFAFYIPFRWNEELFAPINPFKQFRGTGRFIFVFYYVYLVYSFVFIDKLYKKNGLLLKLFFALMLLITANDIHNAAKYMKYRFHSYGEQDAFTHYQKFTEKLLQKSQPISDYESIIVYPPSTEGTEKVWIDNDWNAKVKSFWVSYFSGLPMVNMHSSRVDFDNAMAIFQLSGFYTMPKPIVSKFSPNKKQLVLLEKKRLQDDIPLIQNAKFIDSLEDIALLEIDLKSLNNKQNNKTFWVDSSYQLIVEKSFKQGKNIGKLINQSTEILELDLNNKNINSLRILFWYTPNYFKNSSVPICSLYSIDEQNKEQLIKDWRESHTDTYNYKDGWLCVDYELETKDVSKKMILKLDAKQIYLADFRVYGK